MKVYVINGTKINSPKKIYRVDEVLCHKKGDFYEPISPNLLFKITMARLPTKEGEEK